MSVTLSLTQEQTFTALRNFLISVLPAGVDVIQAQQNRTPEPSGDDFVTMTPLVRTRLATDITTFADGFPVDPQTRSDLQETQFSVQLDVHGPNSADNSQIITTLFRSDYAVDQFATSGFDVTPLYTSEPKQIPYLNGEQQIEDRWIVDVELQCNPTVTTPQQFADAANVSLINVDVVYPPS